MKTKSEQELIREIFVKIKPIFMKDVYIINHRYIISGPKSNDEVHGSFLCILQQKYTDAFKVMYPDGGILYVEDLVSIKDEQDSHYRYIKEESEVNKINNTLESYIYNIDSFDGSWKNMIEDYPGIIEDIYVKQHSHGILVNGGKEVINIGKSLFPTITAKSITKCDYIVTYLKKMELYELIIRYNHTHFQLFLQYFAIPMRSIDE